MTQDPRTAQTRKMPVVSTTKEDPRTAPTKILPAVKKTSVMQKVIKMYATILILRSMNGN